MTEKMAETLLDGRPRCQSTLTMAGGDMDDVYQCDKHAGHGSHGRHRALWVRWTDSEED